MDESPKQPEEVLCPGCGRFNVAGTHFCEACGAPLTTHATTDPLGTVFAEGYAARRALQQPSKPIIVIGVWLWMLPFGIIALGGLLASIYFFLDGLFARDLGQAFIAIVAGSISLTCVFIASTLLYRVTRKAREAKRLQLENAGNSIPSPQTTDAEPVDCLKCGQSIPPGLTQCPACGWSYADGAEPLPSD